MLIASLKPEWRNGKTFTQETKQAVIFLYVIAGRTSLVIKDYKAAEEALGKLSDLTSYDPTGLRPINTPAPDGL